MSADSVLIVAFDGLDYELIDEYGLTYVKQHELGRIDNHTGVKEIKTGELFTSFITGRTWEEHGITGVKGWDAEMMNWLESTIPKQEPFYSWGATVKNVVKCIGGFDRKTYTKENITGDTIFDTIEDSVSLNLPAYDTNTAIEVFAYVVDRYGIEHAAREAEKEFTERKKEFLQLMRNDPHTFVLAHFHYLDFMNHLFGDTVTDEERLQQSYRNVDDFAEKILSNAEDKYDTIIFMSDHGLPTATAHNENAFYSCNREIGLDTPHITDFRGIIENLVHDTDADTGR